MTISRRIFASLAVSGLTASRSIAKEVVSVPSVLTGTGVLGTGILGTGVPATDVLELSSPPAWLRELDDYRDYMEGLRRRHPWRYDK